MQGPQVGGMKPIPKPMGWRMCKMLTTCGKDSQRGTNMVKSLTVVRIGAMEGCQGDITTMYTTPLRDMEVQSTGLTRGVCGNSLPM
ncbi:unnamed protein product [Darwinula stevensoni]|uniref:Uncharacterized protein n=1 Tax=Darwinula stevensoni TaxID=69355 RepID=A0A7R9AHU5_9CRUS|nr:unnamed protein product [Darwinula stevensoni]CAG0905437.1 unnamed protein product [Darwinula stevensoni]